MCGRCIRLDYRTRSQHVIYVRHFDRKVWQPRHITWTWCEKKSIQNSYFCRKWCQNSQRERECVETYHWSGKSDYWHVHYSLVRPWCARCSDECSPCFVRSNPNDKSDSWYLVRATIASKNCNTKKTKVWILYDLHRMKIASMMVILTCGTNANTAICVRFPFFPSKWHNYRNSVTNPRQWPADTFSPCDWGPTDNCDAFSLCAEFRVLNSAIASQWLDWPSTRICCSKWACECDAANRWAMHQLRSQVQRSTPLVRVYPMTTLHMIQSTQQKWVNFRFV